MSGELVEDALERARERRLVAWAGTTASGWSTASSSSSRRIASSCQTARLPAPGVSEPALTVEAMHAARVMMRNPATQRTYEGIYARFAGWLAEREAVREPAVSAFTSEAFLSYLEELEDRCSPSGIKKERAALRKLARYPHQLQLLDATVILMVEIPTVNDTAPARQGLNRAAWERVLTAARARLTRAPPRAVLAGQRRRETWH